MFFYNVDPVFLIYSRYLGLFLMRCKSATMNELLSRQAKTLAESIRSGRLLTARNDNAADARLRKGFEGTPVVDAKLRAAPINISTARRCSGMTADG